MKKFCIIAVDYEYHVPRTGKTPSIQTGLQSIANQTFRDFNIVICHDGPKEKTYEEEGIDFKALGIEPILINTEKRMNDWGHSSRDLAMKYAYENNLGEYYIQFNIDNLLYKNALEYLNNEIDKTTKNIFLFSIIHHVIGAVVSGDRPVFHKTDALQVVAHRDVWKECGFWEDKRYDSDGYIYTSMCAHLPDEEPNYHGILKVLGENF
jgi:hypothetical protein